MSEWLQGTIREFQRNYGEPEYRYFKKYRTWSKPRRGHGSHVIPLGEGTEVSKEEYDANIAESDRIETEAFWGRYPRSYWSYYRTMSKEGWREKLIKAVEDATP